MMSFRVVVLVALSSVAFAGCDERPVRVSPKDSAITVVPTGETAVMPDAEDAADDPAIWVHPAQPSQSLIIGTNKKRGLAVYRLDGAEVSKRDDGRMNNVDLRQNVVVGDFQGDLVAATNRTDKSIALYAFDGEAGALTPALSIPTGFEDPYGLCMYHNATTGDVYVFANNSSDGMVGQWRITATGSTLDAEEVRNFSVGSQAEGCAADDEKGILFVNEEDVAIYAYAADPEAAKANNNARETVDTVANGHLTADAEGVTVLKTADGGGYIIASSQGSNSYNVYDRLAPYAFRGAFQIGPTSEATGIDGVEETDGVDATSASLGGIYTDGLFVAQDGFNYDGTKEKKRAHQNFKLVPWSEIRNALKLPGPARPEAASVESAPTVEPALEAAKPN